MHIVLFLALLLSQPTTAADDAQVQHAAATVAHLHDTMLDPASFVLDGVYVTKPGKKGRVSYCYAYRSHNQMGGYSAGRAAEDALDGGRLSTYQSDSDGDFPGYNIGWVAPCKAKNVAVDITKAVSDAAPALYRKER